MDSNHCLPCHLAALKIDQVNTKLHLKHNAKLNLRSFDDLIDSQNDLFEIRVAHNFKHDNLQVNLQLSLLS